MKLRRWALVASIASLAVTAVLAAPPPAFAQAITPTQQDVSLPGSPFAVTTTPNGDYAFASLSGDANGIAIIKQGPTSANLVSVLPTGGAAFGLTVTPDGKYLLDTVQPVAGSSTPAGLQIINIQEAVADQPGAVLGTVPTGTGTGPIEVALSNDDRFAFVTNEDNETVSVVNLGQALATGESASSVVGTIPVEGAPVGLAFSPDGRYLYISNESANPTDPGYNPTACNTPTGVGTGTTPGPEGTLSVISLPEAERDPAKRAQDDVLAYSTSRLLTDPSHALLSTTPVGVAPVGIQLFDNDHLIAVADSNRFTTGQAGTVSILDYRKALSGAGSSATVGSFTAGDFPRQWGLSSDDRFLYLTEFSSNVLAIFPVPSLVDEVRPFDPGLGGQPAPWPPYVGQPPRGRGPH